MIESVDNVRVGLDTRVVTIQISIPKRKTSRTEQRYKAEGHESESINVIHTAVNTESHDIHVCKSADV